MKMHTLIRTTLLCLALVLCCWGWSSAGPVRVLLYVLCAVSVVAWSWWTDRIIEELGTADPAGKEEAK